jgi:LysM repeat protein
MTPATSAVTASTPVPSATTTVEARTYVVKKGDTLIKIAKSQSVKIGDLNRVNNLTKSTVLKIGQKLQIPAGTKPAPIEMASASTGSTATVAKGTATTAMAGADSSGSMYLVKSGDSLWKIAHSQNVTVAALKQANSLSNDALKVGQKLHIPAASPSTAVAGTTAAGNGSATPVGNTTTASASSSDWQPGPVTVNGQQFHIVDIGESPAIIAKRYGVKTDDLMKANNISDAKHIFVGQKLMIPTGQTAPPAAAATAPASTTSATPAVAAPIVSMNH